MRKLKQRVLTAADLMTAENMARAAIADRLDGLHLETGQIYTAAYCGAQIGLEVFSKILIGMLTETEGE